MLLLLGIIIPLFKPTELPIALWSFVELASKWFGSHVPAFAVCLQLFAFERGQTERLQPEQMAYIHALSRNSLQAILQIYSCKFLDTFSDSFQVWQLFGAMIQICLICCPSATQLTMLQNPMQTCKTPGTMCCIWSMLARQCRDTYHMVTNTTLLTADCCSMGKC